MDNIKKQYVTWKEMNNHVNNVIRQMVSDMWIPDIVVGLGRGGLIPATMISHYLKRPMVSLDVALRDQGVIGPETNCWLPEMAAEGKRILIVDDINDSGATINWIVDDWNSSYQITALWGSDVKFATIFDNLSSKANIKVSYSSIEINKAEDDTWYIFPWENFWMHS